MTPDALSPRPHDGGTAPCADCPLHVDRAVASHGPVPARLLFLSGAPRLHEEREGRAFASPAFAALETTLAEAGIDPATVHYATLIGCRPPHQRPLRMEEIAACHERLEIVVRALEPEVVVVCGGEAVAGVLPDLATPLPHGKIAERDGRRYYPIRHPYTALHSARYIVEVEDDLRALAALLQEGLPPLAPLPAPDFSPPGVPTPSPQPAGISLMEMPATPVPLMETPLFLDAANGLEDASSVALALPFTSMDETETTQAAVARGAGAEIEEEHPATLKPEDRLLETPKAASTSDDDAAGDDGAVQLSLF